MNTTTRSGRRMLRPDGKDIGEAYFALFVTRLRDAYARGKLPAVIDMLRGFFQNATRDGLTGVFRREAFYDILDTMIVPRMRRLRREDGRSIGVIIVLDIDRFKSVNDAYGHAGGDMVLRAFGELIRQWFREPDLIGRVGGDEFIVVCEGLSLQSTISRMAELRVAFDRQPLALETRPGRRPVPLSFAYIAREIVEPDKLYDLIRDADHEVFALKDRRAPA